ncbi:MAG TPA: hypothetical protein VHY20_07810, partial [Pirellulales bacterium]|nr:hypothetical protein [Pirellulales bacterium]
MPRSVFVLASLVAFTSLVAFASQLSVSSAAEPGGSQSTADLPLVFSDDFEHGSDHWQPTDPQAWKLVESRGGHAYSLFKKSDYKPPFRSPLNISLVNDVVVGDFVLKADVLSTKPDYNHRDMCLVFGYQDP